MHKSNKEKKYVSKSNRVTGLHVSGLQCILYVFGVSARAPTVNDYATLQSTMTT